MGIYSKGKTTGPKFEILSMKIPVFWDVGQATNDSEENVASVFKA
jgi:hypothetical protein